jgi:hypothetical protein
MTEIDVVAQKRTHMLTNVSEHMQRIKNLICETKFQTSL